MRLPLFRPLSYGEYPFVQAVRAGSAPVARGTLGPMARSGAAALIPDFDALASKSFDPLRVDPRLRSFYESTRPHRMRIERLHWERWALPLSLAYVPIARRLGNLCVPQRIDGGLRMSSAVQRLELPDGGDSRRWVRTFTGTNATFYVAALRTWVNAARDATYWSMAFPYVGGHVMVLMRVRNVGTGLVVRSRDDGLSGTYAIVPGRRRFLALPGPPTHEELTFHVEGDAIRGRHTDAIGDRRTFALDYCIDRAGEAAPNDPFLRPASPSARALAGSDRSRPRSARE